MQDFTTVFVITDVPKAMGGELMTVGWIVLSIGIGLVALHIKLKDPKLIIDVGVEQIILFEIFFVLFGLVAIGANSFGNRQHNERRDVLLAIYQSHRYKIVEGPVQVLRVQPRDGHAPGDLVKIDGVEFEINYYTTDLGYATTVAHNGVLTQDRYVRVYYIGNTILRIDVKH